MWHLIATIHLSSMSWAKKFALLSCHLTSINTNSSPWDSNMPLTLLNKLWWRYFVTLMTFVSIFLHLQTLYLITWQNTTLVGSQWFQHQPAQKQMRHLGNWLAWIWVTPIGLKPWWKNMASYKCKNQKTFHKRVVSLVLSTTTTVCGPNMHTFLHLSPVSLKKHVAGLTKWTSLSNTWKLL